MDEKGDYVFMNENVGYYNSITVYKQCHAHNDFRNSLAKRYVF